MIFNYKKAKRELIIYYTLLALKNKEIYESNKKSN